MTGSFFYLLLLIISIAANFMQLKKGATKQEIRVFSSISLLNLGLIVVQFFHLKMPSILEVITFIYQPVSDFVFRFLL